MSAARRRAGLWLSARVQLASAFLGPQQAQDLVTFLEHMGLIGGFVLAALHSRGGAVDDRR